MFFAAVAVVFFAMFMVWGSGPRALNHWMLAKDNAEIDGKISIVTDVRALTRGEANGYKGFVVSTDYAYSFVDPDGKQRSKNLKGPLPVALQSMKNGDKITVLFNPQYPGFFGTQYDLQKSGDSLLMFTIAIAIFLMALRGSYYFFRKYQKLANFGSDW